MRLVPFALLLACAGCSPEPPARQAAPVQRTEVIDHALPAFGGELLGTDRGEWIGKLMFRDADGDVRTLLDENVRGIVRTSAGIFIFTGLAHLRTNEGFIHRVTLAESGEVKTTLLGRLPGEPAQVTQNADGSAVFLVYAGFSGDRRLFECYSLAGEIVSRSQDCLPQKDGGF